MTLHVMCLLPVLLQETPSQQQHRFSQQTLDKKQDQLCPPCASTTADSCSGVWWEDIGHRWLRQSALQRLQKQSKQVERGGAIPAGMAAARQGV